jgi:hypothetical protein
MRQWPIILVITLLVAAGVLANSVLTAPKGGWVGSSRFIVFSGLGVPNVWTPLNPGSFVGFALTQDAKESAAASLSIDPSQIGEVSAAIDTRDTRAVVVTVRAATEKQARDSALALAQVAREDGLAELAPARALQEEQIASMQELIDKFTVAQARLQAIIDAGGLTRLEGAQAEAALANTQMAITQNRNAISNGKWLLRMYDSFATAPVVNSVKPVSNVRSIAAKGLQGIVIGLFVGVLVALLFDWRSRSSNA